MREPQPEHIWRWAREDYLKGLPVSRVCGGYSLARSSFYDRARREGWLHAQDAHAAEQAGELKPLAPPKVPPSPAPPLPHLAQQALDHAAAAIAAGDVAATNGWLRAVQRLRALAVEDGACSSWYSLRKKMETEPAATEALPPQGGKGLGWGSVQEVEVMSAEGAPPAPFAESSTPCTPNPAFPPLRRKGGKSEGEGGWWSYADEPVEHPPLGPSDPGHPETPQTQAVQGIAPEVPDSPDTKISSRCSTAEDASPTPPPPITEAERERAEAEFQALIADIRALNQACKAAGVEMKPPEGVNPELFWRLAADP